MTDIRRIQGTSLGYILNTDEQATLGFTAWGRYTTAIQSSLLPSYRALILVGETCAYPATGNPIPIAWLPGLPCEPVPFNEM